MKSQISILYRMLSISPGQRQTTSGNTDHTSWAIYCLHAVLMWRGVVKKQDSIMIGTPLWQAVADGSLDASCCRKVDALPY